ncbi:MAG TPA: YkgJ family cysteine cluster protein [Pirellulales bacterium]
MGKEFTGDPASGATREPWYKDGLQFTCTECGDCCTGAPGYVWVNFEEIDALAKRLNMDREEFCQRFVRQERKGMSLTERPNGDCVFFDAQKRNCGVYEDRPRQCRTWPFWKSNISSKAAWARTCRDCPGSGQGELHPLTEIQRRLNVIDL